MNEIITKLNRLAEARAHKDLIELNRKLSVDAAMPPEVKSALENINAEYDEQALAATNEVTRLEAEIKADVLQVGDTVRGSQIMAVFIRPRVTWDSKALDGMAMLIPELTKARKTGEASVQFRTIQGD